MSSQYLTQWVNILSVAAIGFTDTGTSQAPPTREERERAAATLTRTEQELKKRDQQAQDSGRLRTQLDKTIAELDKVYAPFAQEAKAAMELAAKREEEARKQEQSDRDAAAALAAQAKAMGEEAARMKATLDKFREIQKKAKEDEDKGTTDVTRLRRELQQATDTYFRTADPRQIAERYGKPFDSNFSFDVNPEFLRRTQVGSGSFRMHYGLGAEHTWDDRYNITVSAPPPPPPSGGPFALPPMPFLSLGAPSRTVTLKSITQHEQVTTRMMYETATELLQRQVPGLTAPVARFGMNVNDGDFRDSPEAFKGVFGHPVDSFRPTVINNSTRSSYSLHTEALYTQYMDNFTRGPGTTTVPSDNGQVTFGLPSVSMAIVSNASGNDDWGHAPDPSWIKNFYPNHMNIGVSAVPPVAGAKRRDDATVSHIEEYSTQNSGVHAIIQRPRWDAKGDPVVAQYLNPEYERIVEENLWRLTGRTGIPTQAEREDASKTSPALVKALETDKANMLGVIRSRESVNAAGRTDDLRGTSFAAPTAGGVLLAASILYPDASNAELTDAFCSACKPITHRMANGGTGPFSKHDVQYFVEGDSGRIYSPMAGFGEFTMDRNATKDNPDSWLLMLSRLEEMKKARDLITRDGRLHTQVDVGEGSSLRRVEINGQPAPATVMLNQAKEVTADATLKARTEGEAKVREALLDIDRYNDSSLFFDENSPIMKAVTAQDFAGALKLLKDEYKGKQVSADDTYYKEAERALDRAVAETTGHCYAFTVKDTQDVCTTMASLRLEYAPGGGVDRNVILESPDGTRIPMTVSDHTSNVVVTSTPGFMRKPAAGTWKLYTTNALSTAYSSLVLTGTERNPALGIVDVRETVLPAIEKREADQKKLPAENVMEPITQPFAFLQELRAYGSLPLPAAKRTTTPSTRQEFQDYLQQLLEGSELRKGGFIPQGQVEKVSFLDLLPPGGRKDPLAEIGAMLAEAGLRLPDQAAGTLPLPASLRGAEPQEKRNRLAVG